MKKVYALGGRAMLLCALFSILFLAGCKKNKDDNPDPEGTLTIQVKLPAGSSYDLSKTTVISLGKGYQVAGDGKVNIAHVEGSMEQVFLFNENKEVILAGFVSDNNKEISVATTAQVLLYHGLHITYTAKTKALRTAAINKIPTYSQFAAYKAGLEQLFAADPLMLAKQHWVGLHVKAVNDITKVKVIDFFSKQVKVEDADPTKSGITVRARSGDDESIEAFNDYPRRGHAFVYKVSYVDDNNFTYHPLLHIHVNAAATKNFAVKANSISEPAILPMESHEKEVTWKVRVVGVGMDEVNAEEGLTTAENDKLEQMWVDFFAADLLMPVMLDNANFKHVEEQILPNDIERVRSFINDIKAKIKTSTINYMKNGYYKTAMEDFRSTVLWDTYTRDQLRKSLLLAIDPLTNNQAALVAQDIEEWSEYETKVDDLAYVAQNGKPAEKIERDVDVLYINIRERCNKLDEWTVKSQENDVTITPKHIDVMKLFTTTLTGSATAQLGSGESLEYEWKMGGNYGAFQGTAQPTYNSSASPSITYKGTTAPATENIETVILTVYIKGPNGNREIGKDTAFVNVKPQKVVMEPDGETISPKDGNTSIRLYLKNSDGTDPFQQGSGIQFKVEWSTTTTYGHFDGGNTTATTMGNAINFIATDDEVLSATVNITAKIYFKLSNTGWLLRDIVKGTVKISNDPKIIIYYTAPQMYHYDKPNYHATGCGVFVAALDDADTYEVKVTGIQSNLYPTYSDSWSSTTTDHVRGYMGYAMEEGTPGNDYVTGIYGSFSWGGCNGCDHRTPTCTGTARVKIKLK